MDELPLFVESLDDIPEQFRGLYKEADGGEGFVPKLAAAGGYTVEKNIDHLQRALGSAKGEAKKFKDALAKFADDEGQPLDPEAVKEALARLADAPDSKDVETKIRDGVKAQVERIEAQHREKLAAAEKRAKEVETQFGRRVMADELRAALTDEAGGKPIAADPDIAMAWIQSRGYVRPAEEDMGGEKRWTTHVVDPKTGERAYGKGAEHATLADLMEQVRTEKPGLFVVPKKEGTTTPTRQVPPGQRVPSTGNGPVLKDPESRLEQLFKSSPEMQR